MKTMTLTRVGRTSLGFGLLVGLAATTLFLAPAATAGSVTMARPAATTPSGNGIVKGKVLLGKKPLSGIAVTLVGVPTTGANLSVAGTTDPSGSFAFTGLPTGTTWSFSVSSRYKDALFSTDQVTLQNSQTAVLNAIVFEPTTSPAKVSTQAIAIWVDYTGRRMAVQQDLQFVNTGDTAYVGTNQVKVDNVVTPTAISLSLAPGFSNLQYLGRFQTCCSVTSGNQWWNTRPISPGTSRGTVRYEAPITHSLAFPVQFQTKAIAILVPKDVSATIPGFTKAGTKTDSGTTYAVFQGGPLAAGSVITVTLGSPPLSWMLIALIAGGVVIVIAIALIAWFVIARRRRKKAAENDAAEAAAAAAAPKSKKAKKAKAAQQDDSTAAATPEPPAQPAPAPAQPVAPATSGTPIAQQSWSDLADQLARLDLAYESGQLTDAATYAKLREGLVQKLMAAQPPEA